MAYAGTKENSSKNIGGAGVASILIALGGMGAGAYFLYKKRGSQGKIDDPGGDGIDLETNKILSEYIRIDQILSDLRDVLADMEAEISKLKSLIAEQDGIIAGLIGSIAVIQDLLGQQGESIQTMLASIAVIEEALAILRREEGGLREKLGNEYPELNGILAQIEIIQGEIGLLKDELAEMTRQRDLLQAEVDHMKGLLEQAQKNSNEMKIIVGNLEKDIEKQRQLIAELEYQLELVPVSVQDTIWYINDWLGSSGKGDVSLPFVSMGLPIDITFTRFKQSSAIDFDARYTAKIFNKSGQRMLCWSGHSRNPCNPNEIQEIDCVYYGTKQRIKTCGEGASGKQYQCDQPDGKITVELAPGLYALSMKEWWNPLARLTFSVKAQIDYVLPRFFAGT